MCLQVSLVLSWIKTIKMKSQLGYWVVCSHCSWNWLHYMNFRSLILLLLSLKNGVCTSPAQFFFYLSALFCGAFTLRTSVQRADKPEYDQDESDRLLYFYAFQYGLYIALFFLNCFADSSESKVSHFDNVFFQKYSTLYSILFLFWKYSHNIRCNTTDRGWFKYIF